ncbi:Peptidyl-prolyl cis-trans isomerase [hydrothermal vent metagenome]|uniref:peptidylprolyl isomerase n=1 Tax=hydrothermal vent metagenome TaxID=652676 RepID=A0A1W1EHM1_9ZZZZ
MFGKATKDYDLSQEELNKLQYAKIETSKGTIWVKLTPNDTPNTVANFAHLANSKFYDNLNFHRVIPQFMAQGGCPLGTGTGGPDWQIKCETSSSQVHKRGALSMAHAGPNTGGSQFFITFVPTPHLDGVHTVFGGIEDNDSDSFAVLDTIVQGDDIVSIRVVESK